MRRCVACHATFEGNGWACPRCGHAPAEVEGIVEFAPELAADGDGFDPAAFAALSRTEERSFWFRARNALLLWALERYFPTARSMLEIGCGTGYVLAGVAEAHPELEVVGAELFPAGLAYARGRVPRASFLQLDARNLPFTSHFDVVGAFDVLEHITEDDEVLRQMHRSVRPGGGIIVTVPQHPRLWSAADDYAQHKRRYRRAELVARVGAAGLRVERVTSFVSTLLPVMALSRVRQRRPVDTYDPLEEHRQAERFGPALERLLGIEFAAIRRGASLPVGGSLLLIARKDLDGPDPF